jgi:hypothetical protein
VRSHDPDLQTLFTTDDPWDANAEGRNLMKNPFRVVVAPTNPGLHGAQVVG